MANTSRAMLSRGSEREPWMCDVWFSIVEMQFFSTQFTEHFYNDKVVTFVKH